MFAQTKASKILKQWIHAGGFQCLRLAIFASGVICHVLVDSFVRVARSFNELRRFTFRIQLVLVLAFHGFYAAFSLFALATRFHSRVRLFTRISGAFLSDAALYLRKLSGRFLPLAANKPPY